MSQNLGFSTLPETNGFDLSAGKTWIYPDNYPLRDYQYNIAKNALYNNTLVCLPTGLGKTFIAAVIMYNFWRWYPKGKIVFLAPTKPLVTQQIQACHNVMGIPSSETVELTGAVSQKQRDTVWLKKRVIFATPQVFHKDLERNAIPSELVKCVVIDEAHKALGKHSYCESIKILNAQNPYFRILALSATPGNKIDTVHEVLQNLLISHLELRDESSPDIVPYINERKVDVILIPLSNELAKYKERYICIMDPHVRVLVRCNVLKGNTANISKGRIFFILKEFQKKTNKSGNHGQIMKTLNILLTMYHAYDLMVRHGLRAFYNFYQNHSDKTWMNEEIELQDLLKDIELYLGPFPDLLSLNDGSIPEISQNLVFGHNKFHKLKELLLTHFQTSTENQSDTRAIVFVEYRDIVNEVYVLLLQSRPLIRPQMFVGQSGQKQKQQAKALESFRKNDVNVLISTSIGEEGLDVGEVDLIICFDMSQQSPTRLVQRMGRTGRKRDGHIIVLVTDGKEHETLKSTMARRDSLNNKILNTSNIVPSLYQGNPRMIPNDCNPECHKMYINIVPQTQRAKIGKKKNPGEKEKKPKTYKSKNTKISTDADVKGASSIATFFTNTKSNDENADDAVTVLTSVPMQSKNIHNTIRAPNVKLLSSDNEAIDFLTLCTMKKSEKENYSGTINLMHADYTDILTHSTAFDLETPSTKVLDCLSSLENQDQTVNEVVLSLREDDVECVLSPLNENPSEDDQFYDVINLSDEGIDELTDIPEMKFEAILDESSDSETTVSYSAPDPKPEFDNNNDNMMASKVTIMEDLKPGIFESILDESSSDSLETQDFQYISEASKYDSAKFQIEVKNDSVSPKVSVSSESLITDTKTIRTSNAVHDSVSVRSKVVTFVDNTISNPDTYKSESTNNNKAVNSTQFEESMISETQAFDELAQIMRRNKIKKEEIEQTCKEEATSKQCSDNKISRLLTDTDDLNFTSEDDIFMDMDLDEFEEKSDPNIKFSEVQNANLGDKGQNVDIDINDCAWDSEFDTTLTSNNKLHNVMKDNSSMKTSQKDEHASHISEHSMDRDADSPDWISCDSKSLAKYKETGPKKLSKKLSTIKKMQSVNRISTPKFTDQHDSDDDFILNSENVKQLTELESSFFKAPKPFDIKASTPNNKPNILSLKNKNPKTLSAFRAPEKCSRENQKNDTIKQETASLDRNLHKRKQDERHNPRRRIKSDFICDEAEVSIDHAASSDESSSEDEDLSDFVSYTQDFHESEDMRAHYLKTVKSPVRRPGAFLFREPRSPKPDMEIYSQPLTQLHETYLNDSFCVGADEDLGDISKQSHGYSILEEAEEILANRKHKRLSFDKIKRNKKKLVQKRRVSLNNSESSEDETEILRKQIQEESMFLKDLPK